MAKPGLNPKPPTALPRPPDDGPCEYPPTWPSSIHLDSSFAHRRTRLEAPDFSVLCRAPHWGRTAAPRLLRQSSVGRRLRDRPVRYVRRRPTGPPLQVGAAASVGSGLRTLRTKTPHPALRPADRPITVSPPRPEAPHSARTAAELRDSRARGADRAAQPTSQRVVHRYRRQRSNPSRRDGDSEAQGWGVALLTGCSSGSKVESSPNTLTGPSADAGATTTVGTKGLDLDAQSVVASSDSARTLIARPTSSLSRSATTTPCPTPRPSSAVVDLLLRRARPTSPRGYVD